MYRFPDLNNLSTVDSTFAYPSTVLPQTVFQIGDVRVTSRRHWPTTDPFQTATVQPLITSVDGPELLTTRLLEYETGFENSTVSTTVSNQQVLWVLSPTDYRSPANLETDPCQASRVAEHEQLCDPRLSSRCDRGATCDVLPRQPAFLSCRSLVSSARLETTRITWWRPSTCRTHLLQTNRLRYRV